MTGEWIYLNGRVIPLREAAVSPVDIGLLRGYAVFDLLRTANGRPFLLEEHLRRLHVSAASLGLAVPSTDAEIVAAIAKLLARNTHAEATVRFLLTGGESADGMSFDPATPTFMIMTHDLHEPPPELYERGGALISVEHLREIPEAKTTNYLTMLRHKPRAIAQGALDLLYHHDGRILEAATASFYVVQGRDVLVPERDVLYGTVGTFVLGMVREPYRIVDGDVTLDDAYGADEAFLTSTTRGVVPITRLDDRLIGGGVVGPVTAELMGRFREALAAH